MDRSALLGHASQLAALHQDLETGNVSHAYLFSGPAHVGKFTVAKWFATALLSVGSRDKEKTAQDVSRLLHPDLLVLDWLWMDETQDDMAEIAKHSNVPQEHRRKAKAKTDTISIDDVRAIQERLSETGLGTYRVCMIRRLERMQAEAVNALLKMVEEPPPGVVFLLTAEHAEELLPTIVSRARVLHFSRLSKDELAPLFQDADPADAQFLLSIAQGAPGIIAQLLEDADLLREEKLAHTQAVQFWKTRSLHERLKILKPLEKRSAEGDRLLRHLALALRAQLEAHSTQAAKAMLQLQDALESNASRALLLQRFALAV